MKTILRTALAAAALAFASQAAAQITLQMSSPPGPTVIVNEQGEPRV